MKIAIAQLRPVILERESTTARCIDWIRRASGADLVCFGEAVIPAYPFWLCRSDAARFDATDQKEMHSLYLDQAVVIEDGHLDSIQATAREVGSAVILGIVERPRTRGGHTLYCSRVFIDDRGEILSVHRKLMPTYEERLAWGTGDGHGLTTHEHAGFTISALNCWENWMPLARAALYERGTSLHVALWPGCERLTQDITRFIALESRSYVVSASALITEDDLPAHLPHRERLCQPGEVIYDGGSCIATPRGEWLVPPAVGNEELIVAELDPALVREERQNFDPAGHYARPDVLSLRVDARRHTSAEFDS